MKTENKLPTASSAEVRKRMQSTPRRDTPAELQIRRIVHRMGLRYTIDAKPLSDSPRRADMVFRRARLAIFVDGCFWHGCPVHGTWPKANATFWRKKILANRGRDEDTNARLNEAGWQVLRIWEHEDPEKASMGIAKAVLTRLLVASRPKHRRSGARQGGARNSVSTLRSPWPI